MTLCSGKCFVMLSLKIKALGDLRRYCNHRLIDFPNTYQSKNVENKWYDIWEKNKYFTIEDKDKDKEVLKMILPPPNITGVLHIGHALTCTVQDILARWHRMKGYPVIWVPGLDHAGIATQAIVEKYLYKTRGISKLEMGREEFISLIWDWKTGKEEIIRNQLKILGTSVDWSREYFTLSEHHSIGVTEAFTILDRKDMLYRKKSLINWSSTLNSAISDIEVEFIKLTEKTELEIPGYKKKVTFGQIAKIAYKLEDSEYELLVTTTRPETMFGDVAIAVHPEDIRYNKYIGRRVWHSLREVYIPIIGDTSVDVNFGTGAVKITPAHDHLDHAIAMKHNLDIINVIDENGNINVPNEQYKGLPRFTAREKVLNDLANKGLLRGIESHTMSLPLCSRSGDVIEYLLKEQWFIKCKDMAQKAIEVVKNGSLKIDPAIHEDMWYDWLENIRDWCVSRQLWWGHRIPAYKIDCNQNVEWIIAKSKEYALTIAQEKYGHDVHVNQDIDVLDTWFSSALLPFTSMGWPNQTQDFQKYYPLTLMETGHDILFFWVARMVMLGLELTDRLPFKEVLLHGVLCDAQGKKISKSLGNVISPENVISGISLKDLNAQAQENYETGILSKTELKRTLAVNAKMFPNGIPECGVDALRMTLCSHNVKSRNVTFNVIECEQNKFFYNKIWQASKYILLMAKENNFKEPTTFTILDHWILSRLSLLVDTVNDAFTRYDFYRAIAAIRKFIYYEFCDFYLEGTKWGFRSEDTSVAVSHTYTLIKCLEVSLRILAPIAPFIADELYTKLSNVLPYFLSVPSLSKAAYPLPHEFRELRNESLDKQMSGVLEMIQGVRRITTNVSKKLNPVVHIVTSDLENVKFFEESMNLIKGASRVWNITIHSANDYVEREEIVCSILQNDSSIFLLMQDECTSKKIVENIKKKRSMVEKELSNLLSKQTRVNETDEMSIAKKLKHEIKIKSLKEELRKIPTLKQ